MDATILIGVEHGNFSVSTAGYTDLCVLPYRPSIQSHRSILQTDSNRSLDSTEIFKKDCKNVRDIGQAKEANEGIEQGVEKCRMTIHLRGASHEREEAQFLIKRSVWNGEDNRTRFLQGPGPNLLRTDSLSGNDINNSDGEDPGVVTDVLLDTRYPNKLRHETVRIVGLKKLRLAPQDAATTTISGIDFHNE